MLNVKRGFVKNLRSPTKPVQFAKALCFGACAICHRCRIKFRVSLKSQKVNLIFKYKKAAVPRENCCFFCGVPSMGAISRVQVPNGEGSSSHSLRQGCPSRDGI